MDLCMKMMAEPTTLVTILKDVVSINFSRLIIIITIMANTILEFRLMWEERMMTLWRKKTQSKKSLMQTMLHQRPMTLLHRPTQPLLLHQRLLPKLLKQLLQKRLLKKKSFREPTTHMTVLSIKMMEKDMDLTAQKSAVSTFMLNLRTTITTTTNLTQCTPLLFNPKVLFPTTPTQLSQRPKLNKFTMKIYSRPKWDISNTKDKELTSRKCINFSTTNELDGWWT